MRLTVLVEEFGFGLYSDTKVIPSSALRIPELKEIVLATEEFSGARVEDFDVVEYPTFDQDGRILEVMTYKLTPELFENLTEKPILYSIGHVSDTNKGVVIRGIIR